MYEHEVTMHRYLVAFRAKKSSLVPWFFVNARTESGPVKKKEVASGTLNRPGSFFSIGMQKKKDEWHNQTSKKKTIA